MPKLNVLNQLGEKVSEVTLNDKIFGIEPNQQVLYEVVKAQQLALRQGTHKVKDRSEVRGGGKKTWRQKGTSRARQGSIRAPHWRGGGVVFGPTPRSYRLKVNKKVKKLALKSALSYHVLENQLVLVDKLSVNEPKTKLFVEILNNLKVSGKTLVLTRNLDSNLLNSVSNLPTTFLKEVSQASVTELLNYKTLILTEDAVKYYEEVLG